MAYVLPSGMEAAQAEIEIPPVDLVVMHHLLEGCRTMCRIVLSQKNVQVPDDWNELIRDPICIEALKELGLTVGLPATAYQKKAHQDQAKGLDASFVDGVMENRDIYATVICKMQGAPREKMIMMNVFEFVFKSKAEDHAYDEFFV